MLTFKLNNELTNIQQTICYTEKSPIFRRTNHIKSRCTQAEKKTGT